MRQTSDWSCINCLLDRAWKETSEAGFENAFLLFLSHFRPAMSTGAAPFHD